MKYILNGQQSKAIDAFSIQNIGIPSVVLMERAALKVTERIINISDDKIICICGCGNNGADGLAVARQLFEQKADVCVYLVNGKEKTGTREYELQKNIIENLGIHIVDSYKPDKYKVVVDAIFGIGLSREVTGEYMRTINLINEDSQAFVIAVDIPSGLSALDGVVMGTAVKASETVTFGYLKTGLVLFPGASIAGNIIVADIGFAPAAIEHIENKAFTYDDYDLELLPKRKLDGNKGTFGKILIAAGSKTMGGAAIFSGKAAYRMGSGLVKLLTYEDNKAAVLRFIPEALMTLYNENETDEQLSRNVSADCRWATCAVVGPGLSTESIAVKLTAQILGQTDIPIIVDADGLNIIADNMSTGYAADKNIIITPHVGEMSRLTGKSIACIKRDLIATAKEYALKEHVICVLKDARTIVTDGQNVYINMSGSDALATGGSGDVLTGIIAGLVAAGMTLFQGAALGTYIHGKAGKMAGEKLGNRAVMASDIIDFIGNAIK